MGLSIDILLGLSIIGGLASLVGSDGSPPESGKLNSADDMVSCGKMLMRREVARYFSKSRPYLGHLEDNS